MNLEAVNDFVGSDWEYLTNDCWAVFRKASAAVFGVTVHELEIPEESNPSANIKLFHQNLNRPEWVSIEEPEPGCAVIFRDRRGNAVHIGLYVIDGNVLHCRGTTENPGRTTYDPVRLLRRLFGHIEYVKYAPDHCC